MIAFVAATALLFIAGPTYDWVQRRRNVELLRPIVERFRAQGADIHMAMRSGGGSKVLLGGAVPHAAMKAELEQALFAVVKDKDRAALLVKNVWTPEELEALGR